MSIKLQALVDREAQYLRSVCPVNKDEKKKDRGNMRDTITVVRVSSNEYQITIGGAPAPYAVYTNEKWIAERWKGKQNPNEHWIDNAVKVIVQHLCAQLNGTATVSGLEARLENRAYHERMSQGGETG